MAQKVPQFTSTTVPNRLCSFKKHSRPQQFTQVSTKQSLTIAKIQRPTRPGPALLLMLHTLTQPLWTQPTEWAEEWHTPQIRGIKAVPNHPMVSPPWCLYGLTVPIIWFVNRAACWWWRTWCQISPPLLHVNVQTKEVGDTEATAETHSYPRLVKLIQGYSSSQHPSIPLNHTLWVISSNPNSHCSLKTILGFPSEVQTLQEMLLQDSRLCSMLFRIHCPQTEVQVPAAQTNLEKKCWV